MPAKLNLFGDDPNELRTRYIEIEASENDRNGMGHADKFESVFSNSKPENSIGKMSLTDILHFGFDCNIYVFTYFD